MHTLMRITTSTEAIPGTKRRSLPITPMLWCPLSPVAALSFVVNVPSPYLAGVIACLEERLSCSFVQKASGEQATK